MNKHDDAHESANRVDDDLMLDRRAHFLDVAPTKSRCALCGKTTVNFCVKRNVKLHVKGFTGFYGIRDGQ